MPTKLYRIEWTDFSGQAMNVRVLGVKASLIDGSRIRLSSGADFHLHKIIGDTLDARDRARLARSYRHHQEKFGSTTFPPYWPNVGRRP